MRTILVLTLCSSVFLFSQSLNGSSRQAPSEDKKEVKGYWNVIVTVKKSDVSLSSESIFNLVWPKNYDEASVSAEVSFVYISEEGSTPTPISTTCELSDTSSGFLSGTLKPESGALFNLYFSHNRLLYCSQKNENKESLFSKQGLFTSLPYDITKKSNTKKEGEVTATRTTTARALASSTEENSEVIKGEADALVFPPQEEPKSVVAHSEFYATKVNKAPKKNESEVTYVYTGTTKINCVASHAIKTVTSKMTIDEKSIKGTYKE